jgi:hypothetical protein
LFFIFYANITSLSPQVIDYLASLPSEIKALALVEVHKQPQKVSSVFDPLIFLHLIVNHKKHDWEELMGENL